MQTKDITDDDILAVALEMQVKEANTLILTAFKWLEGPVVSVSEREKLVIQMGSYIERWGVK